MQWSASATTTFVRIRPADYDGTFHDATDTAKGRIIKGRWLRWIGRFADPSTGGNVVYVVNRNPCCKMFSVWVRKAVHPNLYAGRHILVLSVMEPVLYRIFGKREVVGGAINVINQLK